MINPSLMEEIKTDPFLNYMYDKVKAFDKYLELL